MANALSLDADSAYEELSESLQKIAEKLFKCLTERGPDNQEIRRPTTVREICEVSEASQSEVLAVIEAFRSERRCFLMTQDDEETGGDTRVDISHESLIRGWGRLKEWVEVEAQSARIYRRVVDGAVEYEQGLGELMTGPPLQVALDWREREKPNKAWAERYNPEFEKAMAFLDESKAAREEAAAARERQEREKFEREQQLAQLQREAAEERAAQAQAMAEHQAKTARRLRKFVVALIIMFLLAMGTAAFAIQQMARANRQTKVAEQQTELAKEHATVAEINLGIAYSERKKAEDAKAEAETLKDAAVQRNKELIAAKRRGDMEHARAQREARASAGTKTVVLDRLGGLYREALTFSKDDGSIDKAAATLEEILKLFDEAGVRSGKISTLMSLADLYNGVGRKDAKDAAAQYYERLLSLLEDKDRSAKLHSLTNLGEIYSESADNRKLLIAGKYFEEWINLIGPHNRDVDPWALIRAGYSLGASEKREDRLRAIERLTDALIPIEDYTLDWTRGVSFEPLRGNARDHKYSILVSLGILHSETGNEDEAKKYFDKAKAMNKYDEDPDPEGRKEANLFASIGERYALWHNTSKADEYIRKSINHPRVKKVNAINAMSVVQRLIISGEDQQAVKYYNEILKVLVELQDPSIEAGAHYSMGYGYYRAERYREAITYYDKALKIYRALGDADKNVLSSRIAALREISYAYESLKDYELALASLDEALKISEGIGDGLQKRLIIESTNSIRLKMKNRE